MIKFEADALYRLGELEDMLKGYVELPTFLQRLDLKQNRVFRDAIWGWEILERARRAPSYTALADQAPFNRRSLSSSTKSRPVKKACVRRFSARDLDD